MTRLPLYSAGPLARRICEELAPAGPDEALERILDIVRTYQAYEFDLPEVGDSDWLLFRYGGDRNPRKDPFTLSFARQFELNDTDGRFMAFFQVAFTFEFIMDTPLRECGHVQERWVREDQEPFEEWMTDVADADAWPLIRKRLPFRFDLSYGQI